ncbi:hypothetical protein [Lysinibacillus sp. ZYM-1]|uniref:hypothetical protein n=1 Tax=Lysinibacillus sp. ZYM-1 TaxID=1681184 RepID=UPI0012E24AF6|nr:hypothetical protein [Lysinibacillus sp. ZYM-1]
MGQQDVGYSVVATGRDDYRRCSSISVDVWSPLKMKTACISSPINAEDFCSYVFDPTCHLLKEAEI